MNHYERLKVTQDAPPEVIRAAYRALANRLHPDRSGGDTGPQDSAHEQMAALNAAYEVLIDPVLRRDYDATLSPTATWATSTFGAAPPTGAEAGMSDMSSLTARSSMARTAWAPGARQLLFAGVAVAVVLVGGALSYWRVTAHQHPLDQAVSDQVVRQVGHAPGGVSGGVSGEVSLEAAAVANPVAARKPTVDELARMSDEELLKALPVLDGKEPPASLTSAPTRFASGPHPLDGTPIQLRGTSQLVDPLAAAQP
ncbi:MAG: J domain-containing protein [Burkholderiales bacterium]|nr:J domain-containing protein [Burkholderiales bacterium]MBH2016630.1 J domain-containing protein [Burkholderiales bacterium]